MISDQMIPFYFEVAAEIFLSSGAVWYAYRLSRLTGRFGAWTLMIVGLALMTMQNVNSITSILLVPTGEIVSLIQQLGWEAIVISTVFSIGIPFTFFLAMRKLYKSFETQDRKREQAREVLA